MYVYYNFCMNQLTKSIIPVTSARNKLGDLAEKVSGENYIILTKGGVAKAALVDIDYLIKLQSEVKKIYQKTFIDPRLLSYIREFTDEEINEWLEEDRL